MKKQPPCGRLSDCEIQPMPLDYIKAMKGGSAVESVSPVSAEAEQQFHAAANEWLSNKDAIIYTLLKLQKLKEV